MMKKVVIALAVLVAGCDGAGAPSSAPTTSPPSWRNGSVQDAEGNRFVVVCGMMEMAPHVENFGRLVPQNQESRPVPRVIRYQFDNGPIQEVLGSLEDDRLEFRRWDTGIDRNYGQDLIAQLAREDHRTLKIMVTDGHDRPREWHFNVAGAREPVWQDYQRCGR